MRWPWFLFQDWQQGLPPSRARALAASSFLLVSWDGARFVPSKAMYRFRVLGSQTPLIPWWAALQHPTYIGGLGMISGIWVGREHTSAANHWKLSSLFKFLQIFHGLLFQMNGSILSWRSVRLLLSLLNPWSRSLRLLSKRWQVRTHYLKFPSQ